MALAADLIKVDFTSRQADAIGYTFKIVNAAGTTVSDATAVTDSFIFVDGASGANAGIVLPKMDASKTKDIIIASLAGVNIKVYVKDSAAEIIKIFGSGTGSTDYVNVPDGEWVRIMKIDSGIWGALT